MATKKNEVATAAEADSNLPDYLRGMQKTVKIGNVDSTDLIIPRVKLLQATSPEVETFDTAKSGHFWHSIADENWGKELVGVPVILRKTYVLWAPRGDDRGILARARDGKHWDMAGAEFTVKPKKSPHEVTYKLGDTVDEVTTPGQPALSEFGSSIPGDPKSPPAASLTYEILWLFPDYMSAGPAIILNTRSQVRPAKNLISKVENAPVDHYFMQFQIGTTKENSDDGDYWNFKYQPFGYAPKDVGMKAKELYEYYKEHEFRANDESEDGERGFAGSGGGDAPSGPRKF